MTTFAIKALHHSIYKKFIVFFIHFMMQSPNLISIHLVKYFRFLRGIQTNYS
jgi:hypothetical protein